MGKIIVTGAAGNLGRETVNALLRLAGPEDVVGLVREPGKAADLVAKGVEVRQGDYADYASLVRAFEGMEKVMLVGAPAFTDRNALHFNVITAAHQAGIKHIVYTAVVRHPHSGFALPQATEPDLFTEQMLRASGLDYTIVRQPPFLDTLAITFGDRAFDLGIRVPEGDGQVGALTRADIGEAQAVVLTSSGHEGKDYTLLNPEQVSFADIAAILGELRRGAVSYRAVDDADYVQNWVAEGVPAPLGEFALAWAKGVAGGEWGFQTGDIEALLGRKPTSITDWLKANYQEPMPVLEPLKVLREA